jgi:hypothetical protein
MSGTLVLRAAESNAESVQVSRAEGVKQRTGRGRGQSRGRGAVANAE